MTYRYDSDLEFLGKLSSKELSGLVYLLTYDSNGSTHLTESLTNNKKYKRYYPEHRLYWKVIAGEIQCFGGNSFVNLLRGGRGVLYKEVLCDVCDKMKVNYSKYSSTKQIEEILLMKLLQISLEKMSPEDIDRLGRELGIDATSLSKSPQIKVAAFQALFKAGGFRSYQLLYIILSAIFGRPLLYLTRLPPIYTPIANFFGPIGWAVTGLWTAVDLSGTAYRVTIPAVIQIAYLRILFENRAEIEKQQ